MFKSFSKQDKLLTFLALALGLLGLLSVYSTTSFPDLEVTSELAKQALFLIIGFSLYFLLLLLDSSWLHSNQFTYVLFLVTLFSLILVLFAGDSDGPKRWFSLGGFNLQPSEFAKISIILLTAQVWKKNSGRENLTKLVAPLSRLLIKKDIAHSVLKRIDRLADWIFTDSISNLIWNSLLVLPILFLILIQPSLGNTIIAGSIWLLTLSTIIPRPVRIIALLLVFLLGLNLTLGIVQIPEVVTNYTAMDTSLILFILTLLLTILLSKIFRLKIVLALIVLLAGFLSIKGVEVIWDNVLTGYQQDRVTAFLNPSSDPLGSQWQVRQAEVAIASGQIFGKGLLQGTQTNYGLLPYAYTDFAYAAFNEQFGAVGALVIITLLLGTIWRVFYLGNQQEDTYARLVCFGVGSLLAVNSIINIGMNLGLMPVTGVPLPLISYGGSAVLVNMIALGLVQMQVTSKSVEIEVERIV